MPYFLIHNADGDTTVREIDPKELALDLVSGDYGSDAEFITQLKDADTNYWGENAYLLIKGEIVCPKPAKVVDTYEIP